MSSYQNNPRPDAPGEDGFAPSICIANYDPEQHFVFPVQQQQQHAPTQLDLPTPSFENPRYPVEQSSPNPMDFDQSIMDDEDENEQQHQQQLLSSVNHDDSTLQEDPMTTMYKQEEEEHPPPADAPNSASLTMHRRDDRPHAAVLLPKKKIPCECSFGRVVAIVVIVLVAGTIVGLLSLIFLWDQF